MEAGEEFLRRWGVKEIFPRVADDFDAPLCEDVLLRDAALRDEITARY